MHMYIFIFYMVTQSFMENGYSLCPMQKRQKHTSWKGLFQYQILSFLHRPYKKSVFVENNFVGT
jgi:hypothetical protein